MCDLLNRIIVDDQSFRVISANDDLSRKNISGKERLLGLLATQNLIKFKQHAIKRIRTRLLNPGQGQLNRLICTHDNTYSKPTGLHIVQFTACSGNKT